MNKTIRILAILAAAFLAFSCEGFFLPDEPLGRTNPNDTSPEETPPPLVGAALTDDFAASGATILADSYLAPRDPASAAITVGGDIVVATGATLALHAGVSLDMGTYKITVNGTLAVLGTDARRVKLSTSGAGWGGIILVGNADIRGAKIDKTSDHAIDVGTGTSTRGGNLILRDSRFTWSANINAVRLFYPAAETTYAIQNNVFIFTPSSANATAIRVENNVPAEGVNLNATRNTFIAKGTSGYAIYITDGQASSYTFERNIFANGTASPSYYAGIYFSSATPIATVRYNVFDDRGTYSLLDGQAPDTEAGNLELSDWDNALLFQNFDSNDLRLKLTAEYPSLAQAAGTAELVGALTAGHANEVGAYGNGGFPPLPAE